MLILIIALIHLLNFTNMNLLAQPVLHHQISFCIHMFVCI